MHYTIFKSAIGPIVLVGNKDGLTHLYVDNNTKEFSIDKDWIRDDGLFQEVKQQLNEYFSGERKAFDLKLNPQGTDFQRKVWGELCRIPYGEAYTYKDVAVAIGNPKGSRAVGMANNKNPIPIIVPCHRVIGANKKLVGYAYGLPVKQHLLELETITKVFDQLEEYYGPLNWWPASSDFEMMVGAILTQNTNWKNVECALSNFNGNLTPARIEKIDNEELAELIRPSGYHNQKAKKLKSLCAWFKQYSYAIDEARKVDGDRLREELLSINGVGGETADSILTYALNKTSFVIDAYTRRIFHRVGVDVPTDYDEFRGMIEGVVPNRLDVYRQYHGLIVEHAKAFCLKSPKCDTCPLNGICAQRIE
ncbi:methylated-DNA--[protein]-cysteine S-methyltransferase [Puteibacter caeruleilacunae]|nr:methylated-DNA--[protein]-cysteine S-methyltransferase [Puteibacter caeruleilacunae]